MLGGHFFVAMCKTLEYVVSVSGTAEYCNDSDNYTSSTLNYQRFRVKTEVLWDYGEKRTGDRLGELMIKYYVYEFEMPEEYKQAFTEVSRKLHISTDELLCRWLWYLVDTPKEAEKIKAEWDALSDEEREKYNQCRLIRIYPVNEGESEELARARAICEENYGKQLPVPVVSQEEFQEHIDDEDFFLTYGNPVAVQTEAGNKLLCIAWPMAERLMRLTGRGDEADEIIQKAKENNEEKD